MSNSPDFCSNSAKFQPNSSKFLSNSAKFSSNSEFRRVSRRNRRKNPQKKTLSILSNVKNLKNCSKKIQISTIPLLSIENWPKKACLSYVLPKQHEGLKTRGYYFCATEFSPGTFKAAKNPTYTASLRLGERVLMSVF